MKLLFMPYHTQKVIELLCSTNCADRLLDLDAFDRTILFFHAKDLQVRVTWSFTDMVLSDYAPGVSLHDVLEHDM